MSATWAKRYHSLKRSRRFGSICEKLRCRKTYYIFTRVLKIPTHVVKIVFKGLIVPSENGHLTVNCGIMSPSPEPLSSSSKNNKS